MSSNISLNVVLSILPNDITILFFEDAFLNAKYLQLTLTNHYSLTSKRRERVGNISIFYYSSCADFQHVIYDPSHTFRGTWVVGTPGSGKIFSIIEPFIRQHSKKGFAMVDSGLHAQIAENEHVDIRFL